MTDTPRRRWRRPSQWLRLFGGWLLRERAWWALLVLLITSGAFVAVVDCTERALRISGLLLQLFGFVTVGYGLHSTGKSFRKRFWEGFKKYWREFPSLRTQHHVAHLDGITAGDAMVAHAGIVEGAAAGSVEERLAHLEKRAAAMSAEVALVGRELTAHVRQYEANRVADRREWQAADEKQQGLIERALTGNLSVEAAGLTMFVTGLLFASLAPEFPGPAVCSQPWRFW